MIKLNLLKLNTVLSFIMLCGIFSSCRLINAQSRIEAIQLVTQFQFVSRENGSIYSARDTAVLVYLDDLVIYRQPYTYTQFNNNVLFGDSIIISDDPSPGTIDFKEKRYNYFIWGKRDKSGIMYGGDKDTASIINVDSISIKKLLKNSNLFIVDHDTLVKTIRTNGGRSLTEIYVNVDKPDDSYCDSTIFRFSSDYTDIPYSLSESADSLKGSKLVEVRLIYNAVPKGISETLDMPRREMVFKFDRFKMKLTDKLKALLERFENDRKRLPSG